MSEATRDVVLVTIDSLRADHCGHLGSEYDLTPTLDDLAAEGVAFENAVAPGPRTPSSVPGFVTGEVFGPGAGAGPRDLATRKRRIADHLFRFRTVAERFRRRGYETAAVSANPWTQYLPGSPFEAAFDEFVGLSGSDLFDENRAPPTLRVADAALRASGLADRIGWRWMTDWFTHSRQVYDVVEARLRSLESPYFLWVFLLDTHEPYLAPRRHREENTALEMYYAAYREQRASDPGREFPAHVGTRLRRAYRDATRSFDGFLDRLLGDLPADPAVVVHADHGEAFGEHGTWGHEPALYRENLHVPLVVGNAGVTARVTAPVSLRRLPAILDAVGRPDEPLDPRGYARPFALATTEGGSGRALWGREWTYLVHGEGSPGELYHLPEDPGQRRDLAGEYPNLQSHLADLLATRYGRVRNREAIARAVEGVTGT